MIIENYSKLNGIKLIKPEYFNDERGLFFETFKESIFLEHGIDLKIKQENQSISKKNVIRGLHEQISPKEQGKLVKCVRGSIYDVFVDIRKNSPTFGLWDGIYLSNLCNYSIWIPSGFLHGFHSLENHTVVNYKTSNEYDKQFERGIRFDDPTLKIDWKLNNANPIVSEKDLKMPYLSSLL